MVLFFATFGYCHPCLYFFKYKKICEIFILFIYECRINNHQTSDKAAGTCFLSPTMNMVKTRSSSLRSRAEAKSRKQLSSSKCSKIHSENNKTLVEPNLLKSCEPRATISDNKMKRLNKSLAQSLNNVSVKCLVFLLLLIAKVSYICFNCLELLYQK